MAVKLSSEIYDKHLVEAEKETREKEGQIRYQLWIDWCSNWFELLKWLYQFLEEGRSKSLLLPRSFELLDQILWLDKCVHSAVYHTAIRELRFIFESFIQAYYLDKEHPDCEIECKLEIIKEIEKSIFGRKLIEGTDLHNKKELAQLYSDLSKYVHSTYIEMERALYQKSVKPYFHFIYDKDLFNTCHVFTCRVLDALVFVLMSYEKRMIDRIEGDKLWLQLLKETNGKLSLNLLKKHMDSGEVHRID